MLLARSTGGIGTHVDDLTRELRILGHEVLLATDEVTATSFGWDDATLLWPGRPSAYRRALSAVADLARHVDVVHAHGHQAGSLAAIALLSLRRSRRPALVVSLHNAVLGGRQRRVAGRLTAVPFVRMAELVTGASSDLVASARAWGAAWAELAPVPSPRVPRLLADPPPDRRERRLLAAALLGQHGVEAPEGADLILTIARLAPQKDLPTLVATAAADRTASPTPRIWALLGGGDDDLAEALREQARRTGAEVHLLGAQRDPEPWLRAASLFVLTSEWEARALVVQEAMAAGTPVVTRDAGGLRDLAGGVGVLVEGSDPHTWSAAVSSLLDDERAWRAASAAGRGRAATWDDGARTAARWVALYARSRAMT
jgi:glycosyltransferase involved in cell wall biosynthesis